MTKRVLFMLAMLTCIFASCSDGGSDGPVNPTPKPEEVKAEITLDSTIESNGLSFGTSAGDNSVSFTTNTNWTLTVSSTTSGTTWCTASATSGSKGSATVKFTVTENTEYDDRSVSVTIKAGTVSKTFKVTQKGVDALLVTTSSYEVAQEGGSIEVEVKANIVYQLEISETAKDWITEAKSKSRALKATNHKFDIALNEEAEKREGEIIFKSGDKVETVKVYQAGGALIMLTQNEMTVSDAGETISVEIKSNIEFGVQMPDVDWITDEASSRGMSSHTLKYVIAPNEGYDSRTAEIVFYDKNSDLTDTLKVVQAQKDAIVISQKAYDVKAEGETIEVKLSANVDFEVTMPEVDWITQVESRSLKEYTLYFKVTENTGDNSRKAEVVFTNKDLEVSESIVVEQDGVALLSLIKDEYLVSDIGETISVEIKSSVDYDFKMPDVDWITEETSTRGATTDTLKFVVSPNETYDSRLTEIIFFDKNSDLTDTLKVVQTQKNIILLAEKELSVNQKGDTIEVKLNANVDFDVKMPEVDWVNYCESRGIVEHSICLIIQENTEENEREAEISFVNEDCQLVEKLKISQKGVVSIPYLTFKSDKSDQFSISRVVETLEYSVDGGEWLPLKTSWVIFGGKYGDLRLRGKSITGTSDSKDYSVIRFAFGEKVLCSGDIRTLLDYENYATVDTKEARFEKLFWKCSNLISAPDLPATTLAKSCYLSMFEECTSLETAPELPAKVLNIYCYSYMFNECTSLKNPPQLPATTLAYKCYASMFRGCTSLEYAPALPATTVAELCYQNMFSRCSSLKVAPYLPATTLAKNCYNEMFTSCKNLVKAPEILPATKLSEGCYEHMFSNCTNLITAPILPALTLEKSCYKHIFSGCSKLSNITILATKTASYSTLDWVKGVADTGTLTKNATVSGNWGVPSGWVVVDYSE